MEQKRKRGGARLLKKEPTPRTRKEKIRLGLILALVILLAVVVVLFAVYRVWAQKPQLPTEKPSMQTGQQADRPGTNEPGEPGEEPPGESGEIEWVETVGDRKEDYYTFLIVGRDTGGGGLTDTILLAAYDIPNQKLNVMSIPRDTMVNIPYDIKKVNAVYNYYGGGTKGINALYKEVSQLVGFIPDYQIVVEWDAIGELVEAIDGVWFDVPRRMNYDDPLQDLHIHVEAGYQLLNGEEAMGVIRWRKNNDGTGYVTGDIGRIETQQAFLKAVVSQCLQFKNVTKIWELAQVFSNNVRTDLSLGNLAWFAEQAIFGGLTMEQVNFVTLPGNYGGTAWCRTYQIMESYVLPDGEDLLSLVNENFNPYREERTAQVLDIMSVNEDGSLSSSTGVVEDEKAARPPVIPKPEPKPEPEPEPEPERKPEPEPEPERKPEPEPDPEVTPEPEDSGQPVEEGEAPPEPGLEPTPDVGKEELTVTEEIPVMPPLGAAA